MNTSQHILTPADCCEETTALTPLQIHNDPGADALLFRAGAHASFKASMLRKLSESKVLRELTTRENNDPTVALIDAWAVLLDVLTFYNERIINEGFIRTSTERLSLFELSKHISYRPKPGVAAGSWLSFQMLESPGAPTRIALPVGTKVQSVPEQDENPQVFETTEKIEVRTRWNAIRPQRYRQRELKKGDTHLYLRGTTWQIQPGDNILIVGKERLAYRESERWDIRTVQAVEIDNERDLTRLNWREALGHDDPRTDPGVDYKVYVFRQRAALFGYNAPDFRVMSKEVKESFYGASTTRTDWKDFEIKNPDHKIIYLDTVYPKILADSWLALVKPNYVELYQVEEVRADAQKDFSLASKTTRVLLDTDEHLAWFPLRETTVLAQSEELPPAKAPYLTPIFGNTIELDDNYPELKEGRNLIVRGERVQHMQVANLGRVIKKGSTEEYQEEELYLETNQEAIRIQSGDILELTEIPERKGSGEIIWRVRNAAGEIGELTCQEEFLLPYEQEKPSRGFEPPNSLNQPVLLSERVVISRLVSDGESTTIEFTPLLTRVYKRDTVKIHANVAQATHGETRTEVLGSGNGALTFQKFQLKQQPLTFVSAPSGSGRASTLEVRVNDIRWEEVPSLQGKGADERVFITWMEEDGTAYVQFGDGITGSRLPTGVENVRATYRIGIGLEGLLKADQLTLLMSPLLGLGSVSNPLATSGAEDPESLENIRGNAPVTALTLDRIVSVLDYEHFANGFAGIGKAKVDILWKGENRIIHLTVGTADGGAVDATLRANLLRAIDGARHDNFTVVIQSFQSSRFGVQVKVKIDGDYPAEKVIAQVRQVLQETFSFASRNFGQGVTPSEVIAAIQSVEGIVAVDLDGMATSRDEPSVDWDTVTWESPFSSEHFRSEAQQAGWDGSNIQPAELLLIAPEGIKISSM